MKEAVLGEKEIFLTRLYLELQAFRRHMLEQDKETVYMNSYKIDLYSNFYNILVSLADDIPDMDYGKLVCDGDGLLNMLCRQWMVYENGTGIEMRRFVKSQLKPYMGREDRTAEVLKAS